MTYVAQKQVGAAGDMLQREVQARSNDPLLYHELAQVYLLLDKHDQAVSTLQRTRTLAPGNPDTALLLADVYTEANEPEPAIHLLNDLIQKHRQDPSVLFRAGMLFEKLQRWKEAQEAYEGAVRLDDDNALAKNNLLGCWPPAEATSMLHCPWPRKLKRWRECIRNLRPTFGRCMKPPCGENGPPGKVRREPSEPKESIRAIRTTTRPV